MLTVVDSAHTSFLAHMKSQYHIFICCLLVQDDLEDDQWRKVSTTGGA